MFNGRKIGIDNHDVVSCAPSCCEKADIIRFGDDCTAHIAADRTQTVKEHSQSVAELTSRFMEKVMMGNIGYLTGALHDIGKLSTQFQRYIASANGQILRGDASYLDPLAYKGQIDHSTAGALICMDVPGSDPFERLSKEMVAISVMSHHAGLPDMRKPRKESSFEKRLSLNDSQTHYTEIKGKLSDDFFPQIADFLKIGCSPEVEAYVKKVNKPEHKGLSHFRLGLMTRFFVSCLVDADRLDTAAFMTGADPKPSVRPEWVKILGNVNQYVAALGGNGSVDNIRKEVSEHCVRRGRGPKGTYKLSVPTGGGKTLSSLRFALEHAAHNSMDRIIYVAPFISIIDQNARAIRNAVGPQYEDMIVEYHSSVSQDEDLSDDSRNPDDNWDSPIILTTMVQYLNTFFAPGTSSARRLHNLANSVIIFDEVQSIPTQCTHMFNMSVNFLKEDCGTTSVLCTATQPELDMMKWPVILSGEAEIVPREIFQSMPVRTKIVDRRSKYEWEHSEIAELAFDEFENGNSVLIILNTKRCAESVSREIEKSVINLPPICTPHYILQRWWQGRGLSFSIRTFIPSRPRARSIPVIEIFFKLGS
jgi:CRISPR-associated endonuclease/helicase Cas3